jgi:hypothetical protein
VQHVSISLDFAQQFAGLNPGLQSINPMSFRASLEIYLASKKALDKGKSHAMAS